MKTELKIILKDIREDNSKVILEWHGKEIKVICEHIEIKNLETNEKISTKENYKSFYNHAIKILDELLNLLDIDLFDAWKIFYNQESFAYIENWEEWENVESIDDLNLTIKEYNPIKEALEKYETTPLNNNLIN